MSEKGKPSGQVPSSQGIWLRAGLLALALLLVLALLLAYRGWLAAQPQPQALDAQPREFTLPDYLPEGQAQARFDLYTGGDQMGQGAKQTGLVVRWGYENKGYWQIIASCREVGRGNALGEFTERVLDIATCNGQIYSLIAEGTNLQIKRGHAVDAGTLAWQQSLPPDFVKKIVREQE